jgi:heavy metal sensor kinase
MQTSIRLRLTAWYVAALALTLLLLGGVTFLSARAGLYHWLDESLGDRAEALSEEVRLVDGKPRLNLHDERETTYDGAEDAYLVLDGSGAVVIASGSEAAKLSQAAAVTNALRGVPGAGTTSTGMRRSRGWRRWRVASQPILAHGKVAAVILVAHDLGELDEVMERLSLILLALMPLALLAAGAGGYALAGRALAPVDQITRAANEISEQDLSGRLPVATKDELGRLATTFNALIERLQQALERQRQFTADASHELRTPLAIIRAVTSQKLMRHREPEEYEEALRHIDEAAAYMTKLATHLLTLARADAGHAPSLRGAPALERERLDLTELLEHVASQVGEASGRSIPVHSPGPVYGLGDPMRLTELFLNLLENATQHTPPDGMVEVRVGTEGASITVAVRDTGAGIPPEHLPHIFERFYRVDTARAREEGGAGLGLAIARWIAEGHGGGIRAESEPGRGTTMTVTLPAGGDEGKR